MYDYIYFFTSLSPLRVIRWAARCPHVRAEGIDDLLEN